MGTRFLATQESDFHQVWKEQVVKTEDRGTLVARGIVGPARWLKTENSIKHQKNSLVKTPNVYLDTPDDANFTPPAEFIKVEREAIEAICRGETDKGLMAGGECAQRIQDLPTVQNLVDSIMREAEAVVKGFSKYVVSN
jgi:NAD(P)H-dependent flavin oxidoreductase YrpB (nitropropane dioxygenase family)